MQKKSPQTSLGPFKAKLRHYHRTASPSLYAKKHKRWEDVSSNKLGDMSLSQPKENVNLSIKLTPPDSTGDVKG